MDLKDIGFLRLHSQLVTCQQFTSPEKVVDYMGAMQAQDFSGALWSIGLRTKGATVKTVEKAISDGKIVRSWPMRGTLHFVASENLRWMIDLLAPRIIAGSAGRYKQLGLDEAVFLKSLKSLEKALADGRQLTRNEMYTSLEQAGISCSEQRGIHIIGHLAQLGYICHGSHIGKQATYVWLDNWLPYVAPIPREEALRRLALSYFKSHGPATLKDFIWWTGLKVSEAKEAIQLVRDNFIEKQIDGHTFWMVPELLELKRNKGSINLLPGFDEFMLGYTDRTLMVEPKYLPSIVPGNNGMFMSTIVINGRVEGLWKRTIIKNKIEVKFDPFQVSANLDKRAKKELDRYAAFWGEKVVQIQTI
ncbi:winged helix DNA-binding domain-containing protein [Olivibacter domesticus]|uniref:Winged helix DNA-binding domain-containing protein n=1 Tax=Olivibacter domesticus TaxID=407022 RepID=A0A1H7ZUJ8_OLID1|nr:winged helix DNA-binding domain-containing protein [Olivibacter domesticus]SEM61956.1 Winged helix DNA-binding domain-containing protein [Olivibacter domesticus]